MLIYPSAFPPAFEALVNVYGDTLHQALEFIYYLTQHPHSREEIIWLTYRACVFLGFMYLKFWYSDWSQVLSYVAMVYMIGWHAQAVIYSNEMNIFAPFKQQPKTNVCAHLFTYELFALDLFMMLFTLFFVVNNNNIASAFMIRICLAILYIIAALLFLTEYFYIANQGPCNPNLILPFVGYIENIGTFDFWWPLMAYFFFKLEPKDRDRMPLPV